MTLPAARLALLDEDDKIKDEQVVFFTIPTEAEAWSRSAHVAPAPPSWLLYRAQVRSGPEYVAFLRGINMIGRRTVKMAELRRIFESMNFSEVTTILASGNVLFGSKRSKVPALSQSIGRKLELELGYPVGVIVRTLDELEAIASTNPFRGISPGPRTKLLITLLSKPGSGVLRTPFTSPDKDFKVLRVTDGAVFSVVTLAEGRRSSGVMSYLERRFGTEQTTRNWNTILGCYRRAMPDAAHEEPFAALAQAVTRQPACAERTSAGGLALGGWRLVRGVHALVKAPACSRWSADGAERWRPLDFRYRPSGPIQSPTGNPRSCVRLVRG